MTAPVRDLWFEKAHRLEEDRLTLLGLLEALADTRTRLNGSALGLARSEAFAATERHVMAALSDLNERQNAHIAEMMAFEPHRDAESGRLGGTAGDLVFVRRSARREAEVLNGWRAPVIASALLADVARAAERQGMTPRQWMEGALRYCLQSGRLIALPRETERVRARLRGASATSLALAEDLEMTRKQVTNALSNLRERGLARYTGAHGSREYPWMSLEEL